MAYIRTHDTTQRRNGKPVKRYEVVFREPVKDEFGVPVPLDPHRPDGPKRMRSRQESYPTRKAAEARRDELNAAKHTTGTEALADARKAGELPFGQYAKGWLDEQRTKVATSAMKQSTFELYEGILRVHVLPRFGDRAVGAITVADCRAFRADLSERLSGATIANVWRMFRAVLRDAFKQNAIPALPTDGVERNRRAVGDRAAKPRRALTGSQIAAVAAKVGERHPVYKLCVLFMAYSGLRRAETQGLEVRDLVFTAGPDGQTRCAVRVERTKARRRGEWITSTPKSRRSKRTVPLPSWLAVRMAAYLADVHPHSDDPQAPLWPRRAVGGARRKGEPVAIRLDWSGPCSLSGLHDDIVRPALEAVGIPATRPARTLDDGTVLPAVKGFRLHDWRHTFAALQLSAGTHFMQVSKWLGHASYLITMSVYADWIQDEQAANTLPEPVAAPTAGNVVKMPARQSG